MALPVDLSGTWKLDRSSDNIDDFWNALNGVVGFVERQKIKVMKKLKPTCIITQNGDHIKFDIELVAILSKVSEYDIGVTVEEERNGGKYDVTFSWDETRLKTELQAVGEKGLNYTIYRELVGEELVLNIVIPSKNVDVKRYFKKQN